MAWQVLSTCGDKALFAGHDRGVARAAVWNPRVVAPSNKGASEIAAVGHRSFL